MNWINKTPHKIRRVDPDGTVIATYESADYPIRVKQSERIVYVDDGTPIKRYAGTPTFKGMPDPIDDDTIYIVSTIAASLIKRWNFVAPNSNPISVIRRGTDTFAVRSFITFGDVPDDTTRRVDQ